MIWNSLGSRYKLVGFIPVSKKVGGLFVVNTDVVVLEHTGEEVIDLPRYIQDVLNPAWQWQRWLDMISLHWACLDNKLKHILTQSIRFDSNKMSIRVLSYNT